MCCGPSVKAVNFEVRVYSSLGNQRVDWTRVGTSNLFGSWLEYQEMN